MDADGLWYGGEGGIRTHGTLTRTPVFETSTFNHSVTSPNNIQNIDVINYLCLTNKNNLSK